MVVRHPPGSYIVHPLLSLEVATPENKSIHWPLSSIYRRSASKAVLSRMHLALHATSATPHGASCLVQAISAWSVKIRRAPSRHCRDARVYGHTTTDMHDNEHTSPATSSPSVFKTDRGGVRKRTILPSQLELYLVLHRCHPKK